MVTSSNAHSDNPSVVTKVEFKLFFEKMVDLIKQSSVVTKVEFK